MNFKLDRKMKIFIGGVVLVLAVFIFFAVLLLKESPQGEKLLKNTVETSSSQQKETGNSGTVLKNATYSKAIFNGNPYDVKPGDFVIDSEGNLFIKADYLGLGLGLPVKREKDTVWVGPQSDKDKLNKGNEEGKEVGEFLSDMEHLRLYTPPDENMDLMELYKDRWSEKSNFTVAGTVYQKGIGLHLEYASARRNPSVSIDYNTARNYKKFKAYIGIDDEFKDTSRKYIVKVYSDKEKKFESTEFRGGDFVLPIDLDISGVIRLTIEIKRVDTEDSFNQKNETKIVIANAQLIK